MAKPARLEIRIMVMGFLFLALFGAALARLWWVQVARGDIYTARIRSASEVTVRLPPVRGEILDRNGYVLATNRASYDLDFYLPDMVRAFRDENREIPTVGYRQVVRGMMEDRRSHDVVKIANESVISRLGELGLARDYNAERLQRHYRNDQLIPYPYLRDLDFESLARISEHDLHMPGAGISVKPVRYYPFGAMAAHIIGYTGARDPDREEARKYDFYQGDVEGKISVERAMDDYLRGEPGTRVLVRDVKGVIGGELRVDPPKQGDNVYLTLDARIQHITEEALRVVGRGAAVVVDPNNGDILAMATVPSFDPNTFIPSISAADWAELTSDPTDPLTSRATGAYAPGSTYKIPISLAGLKSGLTPHSRFTCSGSVQYGRHSMRCWIALRPQRAHGSMALENAIKVSCNAFYYQYGNAAGINNIVEVGRMLGFGETSGVELSGESPGILPGPDWLAAHHPAERWSDGHTANVSIGQGFVLTSPLQMAMATATVANGGISYYPRLVDRIVSQDESVVIREEPRVRANLLDHGLTAEQVETVRSGMKRVVHEAGGTASRAKIEGVEVAGKTGTAQFWRDNVKDNHAWFIAFAPYDDPKYAVCVMIQGAKAGGAVAAPIAARILEESLGLDHGYEPSLASLEPARGNFKFVEAVNYDSASPVVFGRVEEETADHVAIPEAGQAPQVEQPMAFPDIEPEADEQGRIIPRAIPVRPPQTGAPQGSEDPRPGRRLRRGGRP